MKVPGRFLAVAAIAFSISGPAGALNYPCSMSKGGVERCEGAKSVCRDGSISSSRRLCTPESAEEFRRQWELDNGQQPAAEPQGLLPSPIPLVSASPAQRVRIVDGDTIVVDGETYRLEGIDAPEMKQSCADAGGTSYPCGRRAKEALAAMITAPVTCEKTGQDKYGRSLGYCSAGGTDLNRQMVAQGWAMAFVRYNLRYVADEAAARAEKRGMWAGSVQPPWEWRAAEIASLAPKGGCVIKGNISHGRKIYFLPFHLMYARVKVDEAAGERWFCSEADAIAAGWERAPR